MSEGTLWLVVALFVVVLAGAIGWLKLLFSQIELKAADNEIGRLKTKIGRKEGANDSLRQTIAELQQKSLPWQIDDPVTWKLGKTVYDGYRVVGFAPANSQYIVPTTIDGLPVRAVGQVSKKSVWPDVIVGKPEKGVFVVRRPMPGTLRSAD